MKAIIAGGRDFVPEKDHYLWMARLFHEYPINEIVSGGCRGADKFGEDYARHYQLKLTVFPADWNAYGKSAGPKRNEKMAEYADMCILLPGGCGTADMESRARAHGLKIAKYGE